MKKELLNGVGIPYDKPIEELKELLFSPNMKNFSLACEALSYSDSEEAYELLKSFIDHKDKYRRLYILKTIFRMPYSAELIPYLESYIVSDNLMFVQAALDVIAEHKIKVSENILRNTISAHLNKLGLELYSLTILENNSENYRYLTDLLSYVAVGARSVENQQHRLTASGIEVPVGMKNPTSGDLAVMMNSIKAAQSSHTFIYRGWEVLSSGNPYAHAILRGYEDYAGRNISNYHYEDLLRLSELYEQSGLANPSVIVDTNHNNSGKKYLEQIRIAKDVVYSRNQNASIKRLVRGLMIESYIEDGSQGVHEHTFGKSITDPCLGWEKTEQLIYDIAEKL